MGLCVRLRGLRGLTRVPFSVAEIARLGNWFKVEVDCPGVDVSGAVLSIMQLAIGFAISVFD